MKTCGLLLLLVILKMATYAQSTPIFDGNGDLDTVSWNTGRVDSLEIEGINALFLINIAPNTPAQTRIIIDANLRQLIKVTSSSKLMINLKEVNGKMPWIHTNNIIVTITTPDLHYISNNANNTVKITGVHNNSLIVDNEINGKISITGKTTSLSLDNRLNGIIEAEGLVATTATVRAETNGAVTFNAIHANVIRADNSRCKITNVRSK